MACARHAPGAKVLKMQKLLIALFALMTVAGSAVAGLEAHAHVDLDGEVHTVDAWVNDDGSHLVLVDGQPVEAPAAPEAPELPTLP